MRYRVEHEVPGRLRVRLDGMVADADADALSQVVLGCAAVRKVTVYPRIGSLAVSYDAPRRREVLVHLARIDEDMMRAARAECQVALAPRTHLLLLDIADLVGGFYLRKLLPPLRRISMGLAERFGRSYRFIMGFNSALLALGIGGVITPQTSSLLHNGSTVALGVAATRGYV